MSPEERRANQDKFQRIIDGLMREADHAVGNNKREAAELINMASDHIQTAHGLFLRAADLLGVEYDEFGDTTNNNDNER
jgi:hypothetical protein